MSPHEHGGTPSARPFISAPGDPMSPYGEDLPVDVRGFERLLWTS